jgi:hypothetical protein
VRTACGRRARNGHPEIETERGFGPLGWLRALSVRSGCASFLGCSHEDSRAASSEPLRDFLLRFVRPVHCPGRSGALRALRHMRAFTSGLGGIF